VFIAWRDLSHFRFCLIHFDAVWRCCFFQHTFGFKKEPSPIDPSIVSAMNRH
jgi:hypothetical protein